MGFFSKFNRTKSEIKDTPLPQTNKQDNELSYFIDSLRNLDIQIPKPYESRAYDWVTFGQHNSFPLELLDYRNSCSIHSSIIKSKTLLITGQGFLWADERVASNAWMIDNFKLVPFWRKLDQIFNLVTRDQQTFGYSFFEVIYSIDHTRIVDINWVDASRVVCGKRDESGNINKFYYSENWKDLKNYPTKEIPTFDPNKEDQLRQLVMIKNPENSMDYYALPDYYPALKWIKSNIMMADYNMNAIGNGFSPSIVFKFYKKPTPEERRMNAEGIQARHGGTKNAGKALIFYSDGKELAPDVDTLDATNIDDRLLQAAEQIIQEIITVHRINPTLCSISIPGKLGYNNEMLQSWSIFHAMVVVPERKLILDAFKEVLIYNGVSNVKIEDLVPIQIEE